MRSEGLSIPVQRYRHEGKLEWDARAALAGKQSVRRVELFADFSFVVYDFRDWCDSAIVRCAPPQEAPEREPHRPLGRGFFTSRHETISVLQPPVFQLQAQLLPSHLIAYSPV